MELELYKLDAIFYSVNVKCNEVLMQRELYTTSPKVPDFIMVLFWRSRVTPCLLYIFFQ